MRCTGVSIIVESFTNFSKSLNVKNTELLSVNISFQQKRYFAQLQDFFLGVRIK